jgi:hypothetical protein
MTTGGWISMIFSLTTMIALVTFSFYKVLFDDKGGEG